MIQTKEEALNQLEIFDDVPYVAQRIREYADEFSDDPALMETACVYYMKEAAVNLEGLCKLARSLAIGCRERDV